MVKNIERELDEKWPNFGRNSNIINLIKNDDKERDENVSQNPEDFSRFSHLSSLNLVPQTYAFV